jgi:hypothetical protein
VKKKHVKPIAHIRGLKYTHLDAPSFALICGVNRGELVPRRLRLRVFQLSLQDIDVGFVFTDGGLELVGCV